MKTIEDYHLKIHLLFYNSCFWIILLCPLCIRNLGSYLEELTYGPLLEKTLIPISKAPNSKQYVLLCLKKYAPLYSWLSWWYVTLVVTTVLKNTKKNLVIQNQTCWFISKFFCPFFNPRLAKPFGIFGHYKQNYCV